VNTFSLTKIAKIAAPSPFNRNERAQPSLGVNQCQRPLCLPLLQIRVGLALRATSPRIDALRFCYQRIALLSLE
jgi:hypothetical protein